jgi:hypothetical protein
MNSKLRVEKAPTRASDEVFPAPVFVFLAPGKGRQISDFPLPVSDRRRELEHLQNSLTLVNGLHVSVPDIQSQIHLRTSLVFFLSFVDSPVVSSLNRNRVHPGDIPAWPGPFGA